MDLARLRSFFRLSLISVVIVGIYACGGGGGGGSDPVITSTPSPTPIASTPTPVPTVAPPTPTPTATPILTLELGAPTSNPIVIPPSASATNVQFLAIISGSFYPEQVTLEEVDNNGNLLSSAVTQLKDDGTDGDTYRGDRTYSGTVSIDSVSSEERFYRVRADKDNKTLYSGMGSFWISGCPPIARPSNPAKAVFDDATNAFIFSNELLLTLSDSVVPELSQINKILTEVGGQVVGCIPALRQYLVEIADNTTVEDVYADIATLMVDSDVVDATPNTQILGLVESAAVTCDDQDCQWYLERIRAPQAWALAGAGDEQQAVAVIDFGVDCTHQELDCDGEVFNEDLIDHGTGVAGLISAKTGDGTDLVGVAWNTELYPYSFLGAGGSQYKMSELITLSMSEANIKVINISAATALDPGDQIRNAMCGAIDSGRLIVVAAGNAAIEDGCVLDNIYPSQYNTRGECENGADLASGLIVVGATDEDNNLAEWEGGQLCSNISHVDVYAPGKDIYTASGASGYASKEGTSFAAPLVAGSAAVIWAAQPTLTVSELHDQLVDSSAILSSDTDNERFKTGDDKLEGLPLLDLYSAVGGQEDAPVPTVITPNAFAFNAVVDALLNTLIPSNEVTITGIETSAPIDIAGGFYSIDDGPFTSAAGLVNANQRITVQVRSSEQPNELRRATLTVGDARQSFDVRSELPDTQPDNFNFIDRKNVGLGNDIESNTLAIPGINTETAITIEDGMYVIGGGDDFTDQPGTVDANESIRIRVTAADTPETSNTATITIGGVSDTFSVETEMADIDPDGFRFSPTSNQELNSTQTASIQTSTGSGISDTIIGINTDAAISISGGEYSIGENAFRDDASSVRAGQRIRVRHTSANGFGSNTFTTLTIGTYSATFRSTTIVNLAPTASNVTIGGITNNEARVGDTLNSTYDYSDFESNPQSTAAYQWLRNGTAINAAINNTYIVTAADSGQELSLEITPTATEGERIGVATLSINTINILNSAPTISNIQIVDDNEGVLEIGDILSVTYVYDDVDEDAESTPAYIWLRNGAEISGATNSTYTLTENDAAQSITVNVTPNAEIGNNETVTTESPAMVTGNVPPIASSLTIAGDTSGNANVGDILAASFIYSDVDNDQRGMERYQWTRSGSDISGATSTTYTLVNEDSGESIAFEVTPVALTGSTDGVAVTSATVAIVVAINARPEASNVVIEDESNNTITTALVGDVLTAAYSYSDAENDIQNTVSTSIRWLRNGAAIDGAVQPSYRLTAEDRSQEITVEVTAVALTGEAEALPVLSQAISVSNSDTTPDRIAFTPVFDVLANTTVESNVVEISGIEAPARIAIDQGEYRINDGEYRTGPGRVVSGDSVQVRQVVALLPNVVSQAALTVGDITAVFAATSQSQNSPPVWNSSIQFGVPSLVEEGVDARSLPVAADVNGDGHNDFVIVLSGPSGEQIVWYENDGSSTPSFIQRNIGALFGGDANRVESFKVVDFDGDSDLDIVVAASWYDSGSRSGLSWYENRGGGEEIRFREHLLIDAGGDHVGHDYLDLGDLDRDGDLDILASSNRGMVWYENTGTSLPTFVENQILPPIQVDGFSDAMLRDMNGDGNLDILFLYNTNDQQYTENSIAWFESNGAVDPQFTFRFVMNVTTYPSDNMIAAADLDGDGAQDILVKNIEEDVMYWYRNHGDGIAYTQQSLTSEPLRFGRIKIVDIDGDLDLDILSDYDSTLLENDGSSRPVFHSRVIDRNERFGPGVDVGAGDMDTDGVQDLIVVERDKNYEESISIYPLEQASYFVAESSTLQFTQAATDPDGNAVSYSILSGSDSELFSINSNTGELTFANAPPVSAPQDSNQDNIYRVWISATDSIGSVNRQITVHVVPAAPDIDNDGTPNEEDALPNDPNNDTDFDGDGIGDRSDPDDDNDGVADELDGAPRNAESAYHPQWSVPAYQVNARSISDALNTPLSVSLADIDGDGDLDAISASYDDGAIILHENDGGDSPAFTHQTIFAAVNEHARSVTTADLDGDGDIDIAVGTDSQVIWLENEGTEEPSFIRRIIAANTRYARDLTVADIDNDGNLDLVAAYTSGISWYRNNGGESPVFTSELIGTENTSNIKVVDFDSDGDLDVLSVSYDDDYVSFYENDGQAEPAFSLQTISAEDLGSLTEMAIGDINRDGDIDIVVISSGRFVLLENDGADSPAFFSRVLAVDEVNSRALELRDLDGDGDLDILFVGYHEPGVRWFENNGADRPTFIEHGLANEGRMGGVIELGDLDRDGDLDVVAVSSTHINWYQPAQLRRGVLEGDAWEELMTATDQDANDLTYSIVSGVDAALFSIDAQTGLLSFGPAPNVSAATDYNSDSVYEVWVGVSDGFSTVNRSIALQVMVDDGDADNDGTPDGDDALPFDASETLDSDSDGFGDNLDNDDDNDGVTDGFDNAPLSEMSGAAPQWPNDLDDPVAHFIANLPGRLMKVRAADIDADGDVDIVAAIGSPSIIYWYENGGGVNPNFTERVISNSNHVSDIDVIDLDGDGALDIVFSNYNADSISWYQNDGASDPSFVEHTVTSTADNIRSIGVADVNGDGYLDILSASEEDNTVAWYESDGGVTPNFVKHDITSNFYRVRYVLAADFDGDGDTDVLAGGSTTRTAVWYENDGAQSPGFTEHIIATDLSNLTGFDVADLNRDGHLDIVVASSQGSGVVPWFENDGTSTPSFVERILTSNSPGVSRIRAVDADGDGDVDIFTALQVSDGELIWYENDGSNVLGFKQRVIYSHPYLYDFFVADLNSDGAVEVITENLASSNTRSLAFYPLAEPEAWFAEGQTSIATYTATDSDANTLSYSIVGGADAGLLSINVETGALSFISAPTVDAPQDFGGDNVYNVLIGASDGFSTVNRSVAVRVYVDDGDADDDGVADETDAFPFNSSESTDTDLDGIGNNVDEDDDNDGALDIYDNSPLDANNAFPLSWEAASDSISLNQIASSGTVQELKSVDIDGDGDLDIVSLVSMGEGRDLVWRENLGQAAPEYETHIIQENIRNSAGLLVGDVNNDGHVDILVAYYFDDEIAWYQNNGGIEPEFTENVIPVAIDSPRVHEIVDLDSDGYLDVVVTSASDSNLYWLQNDGGVSPSFNQHLISELSRGLRHLAVGDLNGDESVDLVAVIGSSQLIYLLSDGEPLPSFSEQEVHTGFYLSGRVSLVDIDGDGDLDLLVPSSGVMLVYENDGYLDPSFTEYTLQLGVRSNFVEVADLDGDGDADLITALQNSADDTTEIAIFENNINETPQFSMLHSFTLDNYIYEFEAIDMTNDQSVEIFFGSNDEFGLGWFDLRHRSHWVAEGETWLGQELANDLEGNDIAYAIKGGPDAAHFSIDSSTGEITFANAPLVTAPEDSNGDNEYKVWLSANDGFSTISRLLALRVYEDDGDADDDGVIDVNDAFPFDPNETIDTDSDGAGNNTDTDDDNDGVLDINDHAPLNSESAVAPEWNSDVDPAIENYVSSLANQASEVVVADLDNDGDLDVVSIIGGGIFWHENDGADIPSFGQQEIVGSTTLVSSIRVVDMDGDTYLDVVSASNSDDTVAWHENDGEITPSFSEHVISNIANGANDILILDVDSDGHADVLASLSDDDTLVWYESDGEAILGFGAAQVLATDNNIRSLSAADIDGDDDRDIAYAVNNDGGSVRWLQNDGATEPSFELQTLISDSNTIGDVSLSDMDGDGDVDFIVALNSPYYKGSDADRAHVRLFLNDGDIAPTFTEKFIAELEEFYVSTLIPFDIEQDGDVDVLIVSASDDRVMLLENEGAGSLRFNASVVTSDIDSPRGAASGDLNADGNIDIVVAGYYDNAITWYDLGQLSAWAAQGQSWFAGELATDSDGNTPTYTIIGGADELFFSVDEATGQIAMVDVPITPDDANADYVYEVWVAVSDGYATLSRSIALRVYEDDGDADDDGVNDGEDAFPFDPSETLDTDADGIGNNVDTDDDGDGVSDVSDNAPLDSTSSVGPQWQTAEAGSITWVAEGATWQSTEIATDVDGNTLAYSISGGADASFFTIDENTAEVLVANAPSVVSPEDADANNVYEVLISASDGYSSIDKAIALTVYVNDEDDDDDGVADVSDDLPLDPTESVDTDLDGIGNNADTDDDGDGTLDVDDNAPLDNSSSASPVWETAVNSATNVITEATDGAYDVHGIDLDGDGDLDLLSASYLDDTIAWFENDGTENFITHVISTAADGARSVTTADVDDDGDLDVLSASYNNDTIAWYENDGSENFTPHVISNTADGARSVTTADVDDDGDLDVLSASYNSDTIAWYENDGSENFTPHVIDNMEDGASSVTTADVDGDGDLDVLSASYNNGTVAWYENDGAENFTPHVITSAADGASSVTVADVDGDGDLDVLSASYDDDTVAWYENDGAQGFTEQVISTQSNGANSVAVADVDGDGDLDVLLASYHDDTITWFDNAGGAQPNFVERAITTTADGARSVALADVNGDGNLDVLSASYNDDTIAWYSLAPPAEWVAEGATWIGTESATDIDGNRLTYAVSHGADALFFGIDSTTGELTFADAPLTSAPQDANGDNLYDVWVSVTDGFSTVKRAIAIRVYLDDEDDDDDGVPDVSDDFPLNSSETVDTDGDGIGNNTDTDDDGDGTADVNDNAPLDASSTEGPAWVAAADSVEVHVITAVADHAVDVQSVDLDGDGDLDVLSASLSDDTIAWYENDGAQGFTVRVITATADAARSVATADVDGDGDLDVLAASIYDDTIAWYENDGAQGFTERVITTTADGPLFVTTADVDGDGDLDVLSASQYDDTIAWYENDGAQAFTQRVITTTARAAVSVTTADVDGDGDLDVLSASSSDDTIAWYENDGSQGFTERVISTQAGGARAVTTADVDGDGDLDVLSASVNDDTIAWYENDGAQTFTRRVITTQANEPYSVATADMDGDGDLDVLSASSSDDTIAWYENGGAQGFAERLISTTADGARSVATADVDGDGDLDVLSASSGDDTIAWYSITQRLLTVTEGETLVFTEIASDADGNVLTYGISHGADELYFSINVFTGDVTFADAPLTSAPEDANADNVYEVSISVTDGFSTWVRSIEVTVLATL